LRFTVRAAPQLTASAQKLFWARVSPLHADGTHTRG
jgi:hypothetical protein